MVFIFFVRCLNSRSTHLNFLIHVHRLEQSRSKQHQRYSTLRIRNFHERVVNTAGRQYTKGNALADLVHQSCSLSGIFLNES